MNHQFMLNSIGISGAIFFGLVIFWFVFVYFKRQMTSNVSSRSIAAAGQVAYEEKRRHPRIEINWPAAIIDPVQPTAVQLRDISLGGAFVVCEELVGLRDQFKISIQLPNAGAIALNAVLVWSNFNMPPEKVVNRGMGIKFVNNEAQERQRLQEALIVAFEKMDDG
jgi:c-di-GMP-binding flagellar brake protein YcgR